MKYVLDYTVQVYEVSKQRYSEKKHPNNEGIGLSSNI